MLEYVVIYTLQNIYVAWTILFTKYIHYKTNNLKRIFMVN